MYLYILLIAGTTVLSTQGQTKEPPPNIGDMRLNEFLMLDDGQVSGEPQVFCTDGSMSPTWSYICSSKSTIAECKVMCNQIGYQNCSKISSRPANETDIVWITGVDCDADGPTHIFHCEHTIKTNSTPCFGEHSNSIFTIMCENPLLKPSKPYSGQVAFCPSDYQANQQYPTQSISTGIVSIFLHTQWGALSYYDDGEPLTEKISRYRGNVICQQMGFQQVVPGSIRTVAAYEASGYTFDTCSDEKSTAGRIYLPWSWVNTSTLSCEEKNYNDFGCTTTDDDPCFGCCYIQPPNNFGGQKVSFIVLQCMYEAFTGKLGKEDKVPYGSQKKCSFQENEEGGNRIIQYNSVCAAGSHNNDYTNWAIIGPLIILFLLIVLVGLVCYGTWKNLKPKNLGEEERLQPNSQS